MFRLSAILYLLLLPIRYARPTSYNSAFLVSISTDVFPCPTGYTFLTQADYLRYLPLIYSKLNTTQTYRLRSGASVGGAELGCELRSNNTNVLSMAICVKTVWAGLIHITTTDECTADHDIATYEECTTYSSQINALVGEWEIARIGMMGTVTGSGYNYELEA